MRSLAITLVLASIVVVRSAHADTATTSTTKECDPPEGEDPHADPTLASPKEPADAVEHLEKGKGALRAQDYDEAIVRFQAGAKLSKAHIFLYALGQAFRLSGRFKESIRSYKLFLDRAHPGRTLREVIVCQVGNMQADLDRAAQTMPPTDLPGESAPRQVQVPAPRWYQDPTGLALAGGGLLAGTVGGLLLWNAASLDDQATSEDREPVRLELRDKADSRRRWGGIVTVVGVVALVSGVVKLAITPDAPAGGERTGVALVGGPGDFGVALVGRF